MGRTVQWSVRGGAGGGISTRAAAAASGSRDGSSTRQAACLGERRGGTRGGDDAEHCSSTRHVVRLHLARLARLELPLAPLREGAGRWGGHEGGRGGSGRATTVELNRCRLMPCCATLCMMCHASPLSSPATQTPPPAACWHPAAAPPRSPSSCLAAHSSARAPVQQGGEPAARAR